MSRYSISLMTFNAITVLLAIALSSSGLTYAAPGLAPSLRPLMGWSSWSSLRGNINTTNIKAQALAMHSNLQKYGYKYINIDAGWNSGIDKYGRVTWDSKKFPDGIASVAEYVHWHLSATRNSSHCGNRELSNQGT